VRALRRSEFDGEILRLAVPALGALAADPLVSLVDTAFVGRLGAVPLASLGVAAAVFGIAFAVANFLPYGATPLIAAAAGTGDAAAAGRLGRGVLQLGLGAGLLALLLVQLGAEPVARLMGASPEVLGGTVGYLRIRALALPAVLVVLAAHGVYRGHQDTRTPLAVSLGVSVANLVLDPIFIFGLDLDLAGAAWATLIAQWLGAVAFVVLMAGPHRRRLGLDAGRGGALRPLLRAGAALVIRTGSLVATFSVATAIAARIGTVAVAAHQVAFQLWIFLALVLDALAIAGQARVGSYLGVGDAITARALSNRLLGMGVIFGGALSAVLVVGASWIPGWFSSDAEVVAAVGSIYAFVALSQPLNAVLFVWDGIAIGGRAFGFLAVSMVIAGTLSSAALLLVLPLGLGLTGVWWGLLLFIVGRTAALAFWYSTGPLGRRRARVSPAT
jgi:MATE family multidrug resistance protein